MSHPPPTQPPRSDRDRFMILMAVRLTGTLLAVLGAAILAGKIGRSPSAGAPLLIVGAFNALITPTILVRGWKKQP